MKVAVCGGKDFTNYKFINESLDAFHAQNKITIMIHGDSPGAERACAKWAHGKKCGIIIRPYPHDPIRYGNSSEYIRNALMLEEETPEALIAFPGSSGTNDLKRISKKARIPIFEFDPYENEDEFFSTILN